jgi:hypothetical protein
MFRAECLVLAMFEILKPARRVRFTSAMVSDMRHPENRLRHLLALGGVAPYTAVQAQSISTLADVEQLGALQRYGCSLARRPLL